MTRIGVVTTSFPRFEGDVAGSFVLELSRSLIARGHHVTVLAPAPARTDRWAPRIPSLELRQVRYAFPSALQRTFYGAGVPDNVRRDPIAALGVAPAVVAMARAVAVERSRWDAVISHWALPCGVLGAALRGSRRHIAIVHSADVHLLERLPGRTAFASLILRGSDRVLFVTAQHRERFVRMLPPALHDTLRCKSAVQPMGVALPAKRPPSRWARRPATRLVLLTLARLVRVKGLAEALATLEPLCDLSWWIAGEGPERARLAAQAHGAGLDVRLLGCVTGDRKERLLHSADAFLLPSRVLPSGRSEGAPTALLEAMAYGLPVIASRVGGIPELVEHERTGLLFDPEDPRSLLDAVARVRDDLGLRVRLGAAARARAEAYAWPNIAEELERHL